MHNQDGQTKPKQKRISTEKMCKRIRLFTLKIKKMKIKEERNLIYVKAAFAMDLFVEFLSPHIYTYTILYFFAAQKVAFEGKREESKKAEKFTSLRFSSA